MIAPMSLATRCPTCHTVFRVERDRLTATEGWVRCGHCQGAFNANACVLTDPPVSAPAPFSATATVVVRPPASADLARAAATPDRSGTRTATTRPMPRQPSSLETHRVAATAEGLARPPKAASRKRWQAFDDFRNTVQVLPEFLRRSDRAARWRSPWVRLIVVVTLLILAALAALQVTLLYRDTLVSRWPALREPLRTLCEPLGCQVRFVRNIDALVLDSSGLVRIADSAQFRLTLVLRNRDARALLLPAIDLALTDEQGAVISRRVLLASDLGVHRADIAGAGELMLQAVLDATGLSVAGYTVGIFYP